MLTPKWLRIVASLNRYTPKSIIYLMGQGNTHALQGYGVGLDLTLSIQSHSRHFFLKKNYHPLQMNHGLSQLLSLEKRDAINWCIRRIRNNPSQKLLYVHSLSTKRMPCPNPQPPKGPLAYQLPQARHSSRSSREHTICDILVSSSTSAEGF